jgi:proline iminopeptidase
MHRGGFDMNRELRTFFVIASVMFILLTSCSRQQGIPKIEKENRESILDRVVTIEPELTTEIPVVDRWCDRLKLKKHRIDVGDAELYVEEEGKGIPLILINGGPGGTHHYFHPWFSRAKKYTRVIYYDQRGCGLSDFKSGEEAYSVHQAVEDLDAIRRALDIGKWVLLGYSYGGLLAQFYTVNHPENAAGLILLGASPGMHVNTGRSRQSQFMSEQEKTRLKEIRGELQQFSKEKELPREKYIQLLLYNNFLNGDWKRQHFYKPSPERLSQIALYEWVHDLDFNGIMNRSMGTVDLKGAFENNPIPTLILEGKWDLTWGEKKPGILKNNHPNAQMVLFENAGHGIYDEETEKFFAVLEDFIKNLPEVSKDEISAYKATLGTWEKEVQSSPDRILGSFGWGWNSSQKIAKTYSRAWLEIFNQLRSFMRTGFALYDVEDYVEALFVFQRMQKAAAEQEEPALEAVALIWQGHMLDLIGRREEAVERYSQAADMNLKDTWMHGQYDLKYSLSPYARERMEKPFERITNRDPD